MGILQQLGRVTQLRARPEARQFAFQKELDTADIVREAIYCNQPVG